MFRYEMTWQFRTTLVLTALGPPLASSIFAAFAYTQTLMHADPPFSVGVFVMVLLTVAIPVGYLAGFFPALLSASLYVWVLAVQPRLRSQVLFRAAIAATLGGLISAIWSYFVMSHNAITFGYPAAATAALLALRWPRPESA